MYHYPADEFARVAEPWPADCHDAPTVRPGPFTRSTARWRARAYAVLATVDVGALVIAHRLFGHPAGVRPIFIADGYLACVLMLFAIFTVRVNAYAPAALLLPREGALRAAAAAAAATLGATLLSLLFGRADLVPQALAREAFFLVAVVIALRRIATLLLVGAGRRAVVNELVLVDGAPTLPFGSRVVVDARAAGLDPGAPDPDMLNRIGHLVRHCDRVAINAPPERRRLWREALRGSDVEVELLAADLDATGPFELRTIDGHCTMLIHRGGLSSAKRARKRVFDLAVASLALLALSPVLAAAALAVRLDSPGPILFRQWRVGRGNRQFRVLKFRTMRASASDAAGRRSTDRGDPRVTRVGGLLRRTSLDELPQLLNVLAGDMSIVGPRPHALGSRAGGSLFWQIDAGYWDRHAVKPGMTGLAQVRGFRGATETAGDLTRRLRADTEYIANWSLLADTIMLIRTLRVLVHRNAF